MRIFLFDIDGTLISTGGAGSAALFGALTELFDVSEPADVPFSGRTDRSIAQSLFVAHDIEDSPENWRRLREAFLQLLPQKLAAHAGNVLPGVAQLLEQLADDDDAAVGLLTGNTRDGAQLKLGHYRLDHHFAFGGFGDVHLHRDDVARDALAASRQFVGAAIDPEQVWVIGDTPLDVSCARAIGANVAAVATGIHPSDELRQAKPDILLDDLSDPAALLSAIA